MVKRLVLILTVFLVACAQSTIEPAMEQKEASNVEDINTMMMENVKTDSMVQDITAHDDLSFVRYHYGGQLKDVSNSGASGGAQAAYENGIYILYATFNDLPEPEGTDFYEGWIVRKGFDFSVISTGKVDLADGMYTNTYGSKEDLTDHTFYVLTIEPDDGNPAPADHVLEGTMNFMG